MLPTPKMPNLSGVSDLAGPCGGVKICQLRLKNPGCFIAEYVPKGVLKLRFRETTVCSETARIVISSGILRSTGRQG
jgi:hypothetical protein